MHSSGSFSRRRFLKTTTASALALPWFVPRLISAPPSNRVLHASFGAGGMARADLSELIKHPNVQLTAVADVEPAKAADLKQKFPELRVYQDWRQLLEKEKELTSVNVSTPDHMHAAMGMSAMRHGLHVYGQKPLTHDIYETRRLTEFAREKKLVTQMGIQIHSSGEYRAAVRMVQEGVIGKIKEVHTWSSKKWGDTEAKPDRVDPIPAGFDWDLWLGVCADRPFIGDGWYHPGNWRKRLDFGTGTFGDMGCHIYDPVFKALALTAPLSVRSEGPSPNAHSWAVDAVIHYVFPGTQFTEGKTVKVTWYDGDQRPPKEIQSLVKPAVVSSERPWLPDQGSIFIGTKGVMLLPHIDRPKLFPVDQYAGMEKPKMERAHHWHQFVDAILGKDKTQANFDYAGPLTEAVLLGSVATRFPHTTLQWNARKLTFDVKEANPFVRRTYRKGWEVKGL
ncbi:MAG: Gfo/Idh/MocA family oxidoreductase [Verrucomicrobiales bacterium]|nr:Gfo/Idh/MocA family oxidoreductase [Verrucomicrobiales bacterium]